MSSLFLRLLGLGLMVWVLLGLVPGDSRSYLSGAFELSGLDLGDRHINPWTLGYMSFHFGSDWLLQVLMAFGRSFLLASMAAAISLALLLGFMVALNHKTAAWIDVGSSFFLSLVSVLIAPVLALAYLRYGPKQDNGFLAYTLAALSISFVGVGSYLKFLSSKYSEIEFRELIFGLRARGISAERSKWIHFVKLILPDFLVLFLARYASYLSGVFVAELVFNLRGLGWYFSQAFQSRSGLLLLTLVLMSSFFYLILNHSAIYLASVIDPRRRHES